ncbi:uncharacterized protein LOC120292750 [Eucalyptus grandis]|uniref:uncharacterized protein LOC120292750 n=1 Tax=Eucalyptus grandis TaxID=71139 RepID=UPI00192E8C47|nr:uncharacterized protein LOC120292750 [Eucalyptus grandis]
MADWVAAFGIGLISHSQSNSFARAAEVDIALQAFWASFLLLHLGGPDTITAFSLEDSSLWRRHLLSLLFQFSVAIYVFVQIFPNDKSLVIPTMLVFLAGVIKNVERIIALYRSSLSRLREASLLIDQGFNANLMLERELTYLNCEYSREEEAKLVESIAVKHAYYFFAISKVFLIDRFYSAEERITSHKYFHKVSAVDALRVISIELHFMYEMLYTKALAICSKWSYIIRFIAFTEVMTAFVLFNRFKKHELPKLDVEITYILLFGGIALDVITLFTLVFSDWTIAKIMQNKTRSSNKLYSFLHKLITATYDRRKPQYATCKIEPTAEATYEFLDTPFIFQRWSESISACTILSEIWGESPRKMYKCDQRQGVIAFSDICSLPFHKAEKIISCFHGTCKIFVGSKAAMLLDIPRYTSKSPLLIELWIFIFEEVKRKSEEVHSPTKMRKIYEARGDMFLKSKPKGVDCERLLQHVTKSTYDTNVIKWHVATEILYKIDKSREKNDKKEFSKILSDYLLYLLIKQPHVASAVAGFAKNTFCEVFWYLNDRMSGAKDIEALYKALWEDFPGEDNPLKEWIVLARKLEGFGEMKWEVMSGVWVEMLSYAASHIKGEVHAQVLSKGGELLPFVWLLMTHFGCHYKPEWGTYEDFLFLPELETVLHDDNGNQEEDDSSPSISN